MIRKFDVVIIGAGIMGLSLAYYLKKNRCPRVLVLEKEASWLTGSSARANGGFRQQFSTPINIRMSQLSIPVFENFQEEFDTDIGLRQYGYLFVTANQERALDLKTNLELQKSHGVPVEWLTPTEIHRLAPFLKSEDLLGGTFCSSDGYADSYSIAAGFGSRARDLGAKIEMKQTVEKILINNRSLQGVVTTKDEIHTPCLVNAAGPYASQVGRLAQIEIPVEPVRRMLVMTEDFPEISESIPMTVDADTGFIMRKEAGKVLMGWADPEEPPGFNQNFEPSFIDILAEKALSRVPALERAEINPRRSWAGLYEVTPDHHCILGTTPLKGFILINGFSGHGMMHSPAAGMIVSDLILKGRTDLIDSYHLRLSRFAEGDLIEETVVL